MVKNHKEGAMKKRIVCIFLFLSFVLAFSGCVPEYDKDHDSDLYERGYEAGYKSV